MTSFTLYQGDCLEILPTLEPGSVDAVITDPPYGIDYQSARRSDKSAWFPKIMGDISPATDFVYCLPLLIKRNGCVIMFSRWDVQENFRQALCASGVKVNAQLVWDRVIHGAGDPDRSPAPQHDTMLFGRMPEYKHKGNRPTSVYRFQRLHPDALIHPNEKPIDLMACLVGDYSAPGDTILDPFMGSGTTGVACMRTGRNFIGIELDPDYFRIAEQRIRNAAGEIVITDRERATGQLSLFGSNGQ